MGTDVRLAPSRLVSADPAVREEFDRFRRELRGELERLAASPFAMPPIPGPAYPGPRHHVPFGRVVVTDSASGDVQVQLPTPTARDSGRFVGVIRLSTANAVTCWAPPNVTIGGLTSLALPTPVRLYLWYFTTLHGAGAAFLPLNDV